MAMTESRYIPIEKWDRPRSGLFQIITDSWWLVDEHWNPVISRKYHTPQCNQSKEVVERIASYNQCNVKHFPIVFLPFKPSDYSND